MKKIISALAALAIIAMISLPFAITGHDRKTKVPETVTCSSCGGNGVVVRNHKAVICEECGGKGQITIHAGDVGR